MALTKTLKPSKTTSSIIKTRSQSRTGTTARTGTNDDAIAPTPVAVATGRTTGTIDRTIDVAPAPVDDLFAGRPKTSALKDPPVPRDDATKPAAKPKGRPKKVAPKTTRKPRTDPADDLVDPMSRVQVGDATGVVTADGTGGGFARAGGNDPVLADPDYQNPEHRDPEQSAELQPKKTRRSRAHRAGRGDDNDDDDSYSTVGTGTGGYGNGGNGGGDDDGYDDPDPDADSITDSQGVPEAPGVSAPIIIGYTPEEVT